MNNQLKPEEFYRGHLQKFISGLLDVDTKEQKNRIKQQFHKYELLLQHEPNRVAFPLDYYEKIAQILKPPQAAHNLLVYDQWKHSRHLLLFDTDKSIEITESYRSNSTWDTAHLVDTLPYNIFYVATNKLSVYCCGKDHYRKHFGFFVYVSESTKNGLPYQGLTLGFNLEDVHGDSRGVFGITLPIKKDLTVKPCNFALDATELSDGFALMLYKMVVGALSHLLYISQHEIEYLLTFGEHQQKGLPSSKRQQNTPIIQKIGFMS